MRAQRASSTAGLFFGSICFCFIFKIGIHWLACLFWNYTWHVFVYTTEFFYEYVFYLLVAKQCIRKYFGCGNGKCDCAIKTTSLRVVGSKASCSNDRRVLDDFHLVFIDLYALHVIFLHFPVIWTTCFWTNEVWLLCTSRNEENGNRRNLFVLKFSTKFICNIHLGFYATIYDNKKLSHWSASKQNTEELQKSLMLLTCFGGFSK